MYKTRLQELCHQRMWAAPDYTVSRDGPDHNPRFRASVTVNGINFDAPDHSRSSKEAQTKAAQVAVDHFAITLPPKPSIQAQENQVSYKNQLCMYAQKNLINMPKYDVVREGVAHALRFKANVTVDGQTFYSQQFFNTVKEAENDAAKVALLSLSLDENPQDESFIYKNLLQELAQKEGISLPKYTTVSNGACHMPIFSSTVEVGVDNFVGDVAKTKKQAEMNVAKLAWCRLKERFNVDSRGASLSSKRSVHEHLEPASLGSQSNATRSVELPKSFSLPLSYVEMKHNRENSDKKQEEEVIVKDGSITIAMTTILQDDQDPHLTDKTMVDGSGHIKKMAASYYKLDAEVPKMKEIILEDTISQDGVSTPSSLSDRSDHPLADVISESPMGKITSSLLCNRVRVYPRTPDMVLPEGAILLPFSDEMWVAASLDFSNHEDIYQEEGITTENDSSTVHTSPILHDNQGTHTPKEIPLNGNVNFDTPYSSLRKLGVEIIEHTFSEEEIASPTESACSDCDIMDVNSESPMGGIPCSLQCNRVKVYPNKADMVLPEGASLLPFSDDKWVAVSLDFGNRGGTLQGV